MLSVETIATLYPRAPEAHRSAFARDCGRLFAESGIADRPNRLHFFLAQIGHESGGLTVREENMNYSAERICAVWPSRFADVEAARPFARNPEKLANQVYANRMGNGVPESGDGWRYRGRGYIQITGRDGYANVGRISGLDLINAPELAGEPDQALRTACAFWQWKQLNEFCDTGDFVKVTRRINGGTVGLADRRAWLDKVLRILVVPPPVERQPEASAVIAIQDALRAKGFSEVGASDGIVGPRTTAAILRFRQKHGLPEGLIDAALELALGIAD